LRASVVCQIPGGAKSLYLTQHLMDIMLLLKHHSNNFPHLAQQPNRDQMIVEHLPEAWMKDPHSKKVIPKNGVLKKVPPKRAIKVGVAWLEVRRKRFFVTLLWERISLLQIDPDVRYY
jgi:hypothetical protein